ncbi:hypothetical protein Rsph17029_2008 [Rhodobacter sphaeroides ATCC 17029]|nr:hypothetical protein Rsph17029_2008 [Cereibacter sphaeroides ATCC 17029]
MPIRASGAHHAGEIVAIGAEPVPLILGRSARQALGHGRRHRRLQMRQGRDPPAALGGAHLAARLVENALHGILARRLGQLSTGIMGGTGRGEILFDARQLFEKQRIGFGLQPADARAGPLRRPGPLTGLRLRLLGPFRRHEGTDGLFRGRFPVGGDRHRLWRRGLTRGLHRRAQTHEPRRDTRRRFGCAGGGGPEGHAGGIRRDEDGAFGDPLDHGRFRSRSPRLGLAEMRGNRTGQREGVREPLERTGKARVAQGEDLAVPAHRICALPCGFSSGPTLPLAIRPRKSGESKD